MTCPHGNTADGFDPALLCAQCEADAARRPVVLAHVAELAELLAETIDLRDHQPQLPAELLPRPAGTLPI